jgi:hypothetical protein
VPSDHASGLSYLVVNPLTLEENQPATIFSKRSEPGNETLEALHRSRGYYIKRFAFWVVLGSTSDNGHVRERTKFDLRAEPPSSAFKRFDEDEMAIRAKHGKHEPGQPGSASDVSYARVLRHLWCQQCAVKDVAGPDSGRFVWTNQAKGFALRRQFLRERPDETYSIAAEFLRYRRLRLNHRMFHVKLCAADDRVAVGTFAF